MHVLERLHGEGHSIQAGPSSRAGLPWGSVGAMAGCGGVPHVGWPLHYGRRVVSRVDVMRICASLTGWRRRAVENTRKFFGKGVKGLWVVG